MSTSTAALPDDRQIYIADHKIGSFMSDLDDMRSSVQAYSKVGSVEEYVRARAEGKEPPAAEDQEYDRDLIARLVVFATDTIEYVGRIQEEAIALRDDALSLYHEASEYQPGLVSEWLREQVKEWEQVEREANHA